MPDTLAQLAEFNEALAVEAANAKYWTHNVARLASGNWVVFDASWNMLYCGPFEGLERHIPVVTDEQAQFRWDASNRILASVAKANARNEGLSILHKLGLKKPVQPLRFGAA